MSEPQERNTSASAAVIVQVSQPRIEIKYCTQCNWLLRAAYYAQELLQTFKDAIGEIALKPSTGGHFSVAVTYPSYISDLEQTREDYQSRLGEIGPETQIPDGREIGEGDSNVQQKQNLTRVLIWDRQADGGFPETKVLKQRLRDLIQPTKSLGHSDRK